MSEADIAAIEWPASPEALRPGSAVAQRARRRPAHSARVLPRGPPFLPIPRHVRPRLEEYVGLRAGHSGKPAEQIPEPVIADAEIQERIRNLLRPETAAAVERFPPRYRERYRERVKEIQGRLKGNLIEILASAERELADFRARLIAEYRAQRRDRT